MKRLEKKKREKLVKIIIGTSKTGMKGIIRPTKTITLVETNVEEVHKKILEMIEDESK